MQKKKSKKNTNQAGITLIALVVTIVVLLILAGITINMIFSDNGIIAKAQEASEAQRYANVHEQVELWKSNKKIKSIIPSSSDDDITEDELIDSLKDQELINEGEETDLRTNKEKQVLFSLIKK